MSSKTSTKDIINIGKVPVKFRFLYKRTLDIYKRVKDSDNVIEKNDAYETHSKIVKDIEKAMSSNPKMKDIESGSCKFMIDDDFNFWIMTNDYVDRNFKEKGENHNGDK